MCFFCFIVFFKEKTKQLGIIEVGKRYKFVTQPPHAFQTVPRSYYEHSGQVVTVIEEIEDGGYVVEANDGWRALVESDELEICDET